MNRAVLVSRRRKLSRRKLPTLSKAKPLLENEVRGTTDMLNVMNTMRITRGPGRSLWTTIMDLNARTFEVRYFKDCDRKYEFRF
jgi:hypothetical protein